MEIAYISAVLQNKHWFALYGKIKSSQKREFLSWASSLIKRNWHPPGSWKTVRVWQMHIRTILKFFEKYKFPGGSDNKESACNAEDPGLFLGLERSPGEGSGYPSSIPAWRIPGMEEPGRPQSMGFQRVRYDWVTNTESWDQIYF